MTLIPTGRVKKGFWKKKIFELSIEGVRGEGPDNHVEEREWAQP